MSKASSLCGQRPYFGKKPPRARGPGWGRARKPRFRCSGPAGIASHHTLADPAVALTVGRTGGYHFSWPRGFSYEDHR